MTKARDTLVERRLRAGLIREKPRTISMIWEGRVVTGSASTHKLRSGRLYDLRLRIWRRFHTLPMFGRETKQ